MKNKTISAKIVLLIKKNLKNIHYMYSQTDTQNKQENKLAATTVLFQNTE